MIISRIYVSNLEFQIKITLGKSRRIYTGQNTFPILLLNDDNMLGEHKGREKKYCVWKAFLENPHFVL